MQMKGRRELRDRGTQVSPGGIGTSVSRVDKRKEWRSPPSPKLRQSPSGTSLFASRRRCRPPAKIRPKRKDHDPTTLNAAPAQLPYLTGPLIAIHFAHDFARRGPAVNVSELFGGQRSDVGPRASQKGTPANGHR